MTLIKTKIGRRAFIKNVSLASGGMMIGFSWLASCTATEKEVKALPKEWFEFNGYLKIGDNGMVTILSPNPEIGQNVKTSMPMIVAEELDIDWNLVLVEQAPLNVSQYQWQIAGGSRSINSSWDALRMAGATARKMLITAAASKWNVPENEITTSMGQLSHKASGQTSHYGEVASIAATLEIPEEVELKEVKDFKIIRTSKKNVDSKKIVTGQPLFGLDTYKEGMLVAMMVHPPAFGKKLKSYNPDSIINMPGIEAVFDIEVYRDGDEKNWSDVTAFNKLPIVVGQTSWEVMQAKNKLEVVWENSSKLENTSEHKHIMSDFKSANIKVEQVRKDGDPEKAFKEASKIIERTYTAPFRAHNTMEPMNYYADVTQNSAYLYGPVQTPENAEKSVSTRLGIPRENIDVHLSRMGGGFGRRLYGNFAVEAAVISHKIKKPIKLVYTREDDMTFGTYRPTYNITYRAAFDKENKLTAIHLIGGGIPERALYANRFPAGALDNFLVEGWSVNSNISVGAFRAPGSNFAASAEQSFLDEVAETLGKDPIDFRLELLKRVTENPVGERNDYDPKRYAGVLELVRKQSNWDAAENANKNRGVSVYFCHMSYVANVVDVRMDGNKPIIDDVYCAVDCGIVVNPDAATNLAEGGSIDGIGTAMYGALNFVDGIPQEDNFDSFRMIRHNEAPKNIHVDFVQNDIKPTGMGEPAYPPIQAALANAIYKASGKRLYHQPFINELNA